MSISIFAMLRRSQSAPPMNNHQFPYTESQTINLISQKCVHTVFESETTKQENVVTPHTHNFQDRKFPEKSFLLRKPIPANEVAIAMWMSPHLQVLSAISCRLSKAVSWEILT